MITFETINTTREQRDKIRSWVRSVSGQWEKMDESCWNFSVEHTEADALTDLFDNLGVKEYVML